MTVPALRLRVRWLLEVVRRQRIKHPLTAAGRGRFADWQRWRPDPAHPGRRRGASGNVEVTVVRDPESLSIFDPPGAVIFLLRAEHPGRVRRRGCRVHVIERVLRGFLPLASEHPRGCPLCGRVPICDRVGGLVSRARRCNLDRCSIRGCAPRVRAEPRCVSGPHRRHGFRRGRDQRNLQRRFRGRDLPHPAVVGEKEPCAQVAGNDHRGHRPLPGRRPVPRQHESLSGSEACSTPRGYNGSRTPAMHS